MGLRRLLLLSVCALLALATPALASSEHPTRSETANAAKSILRIAGNVGDRCGDRPTATCVSKQVWRMYTPARTLLYGIEAITKRNCPAEIAFRGAAADFLAKSTIASIQPTTANALAGIKAVTKMTEKANASLRTCTR